MESLNQISSGCRRKRNVLTMEDRVKCIKLNEEGMKVTHIQEILDVGKSQIYDILKNKDVIMSEYQAGNLPGNRKVLLPRRTKFAAINNEVLDWYLSCREKSFTPTGPQIREKAVSIALRQGIDDFEASQGWLQRFVARHQLNSIPDGMRTVIRPEILLEKGKMESGKSEKKAEGAKKIKEFHHHKIKEVCGQIMKDQHPQGVNDANHQERNEGNQEEKSESNHPRLNEAHQQETRETHLLDPKEEDGHQENETAESRLNVPPTDHEAFGMISRLLPYADQSPNIEERDQDKYRECVRFLYETQARIIVKQKLGDQQSKGDSCQDSPNRDQQSKGDSFQPSPSQDQQSKGDSFQYSSNRDQQSKGDSFQSLPKHESNQE